jgi:hypothetical protein
LLGELAMAMVLRAVLLPLRRRLLVPHGGHRAVICRLFQFQFPQEIE